MKICLQLQDTSYYSQRLLMRNGVVEKFTTKLYIYYFQGYHRAFAEIFNMMQRNKEARNVSGPDSSLRQMSLLEHSPPKLEKIKKGLEEIEEIERNYQFHRYRYRALEEAMLNSEKKTMDVMNRNRSTDETGYEDDDEEDVNDENLTVGTNICTKLATKRLYI